MSNFIKHLCLICALLCSQTGLAIQVEDSNGDRLTLNQPARRILSLSPNLTEILFAIGAGQQVVGRDKFSDYPSQTKAIPVFADYFTMNLESVIKIKPDLILIEGASTLAKPVKKLRSMGIVIYINKANNLSSITKTVLDLGQLTGHDEAARRLATGIDQTRGVLWERYRTRPRPKVSVFYLLWDNPLMTVNHQTVINEVLEVCGGENIFSALTFTAARISLESIIKRDPEVVLLSNRRFQQRWLKQTEITAVRRGNLFFIDPALLERTGPRISEGMTQVCSILEKIRSNVIKEIH